MKKSVPESAPESAPSTAPNPPEPPAIPRVARAEGIVNSHVALAMGAGFVPLPLLDLVAVSGVQLKLLKALGDLYGVPFTENRVKSIVTSLLGGVGSTSLAVASVGSVAKIVPGLGPVLGVVTLPVVAGAVTYAVGKVFIQHFESGGTFLTFDSLDARRGFQQEFERGKANLAQGAKSLGHKVATASDKLEQKLDAAVDKVCS
jgi:uncharacterized protein (DUF697 family)